MCHNTLTHFDSILSSIILKFKYRNIAFINRLNKSVYYICMLYVFTKFMRSFRWHLLFVYIFIISFIYYVSGVMWCGAAKL